MAAGPEGTGGGTRGALSGLRVLEVADRHGEFCGKLLADMGAEVIKVERPGGDESRRIGPFAEDLPGPNRSLHFWHYNTNKRSLTLDLDSADGRALFRKLASQADAVVDGKGTTYLGDRGLGYESLREANPRLVFTMITPFGQSGPWRDYLGGDLVELALGGPVYSTGYDDLSLAPIRPAGGHAYHTAAHFAFIGTLAALFEREQSGLGQQVDCSAHEAIAATVEFANIFHIYQNVRVRRQTGRHAWGGLTPPTQFLCNDGSYVNVLRYQRVLGLAADDNWNTLMEWLHEEGMAGDLADPANADARRRLESDELEWRVADVLAEFAQGHTADELFHGGQKRELLFTRIYEPEELLEDEQMRSRGFSVPVLHAEFNSTFTYPGAPYHFSRTPWAIRTRAPLLGEDNIAILVGELGLSRADLVALREQGTV